MANTLGLKIVKILAVTEGERAVRPFMVPQQRTTQMDAAAAVPTPVEAGTIEVRSTVSLTAEVGP
jgi:uncharacterized protein YggE